MQLLYRRGLLMSEDKALLNLLIENGYYISPKEGHYGLSYEIFQVVEEDEDEEK